VIFASRKDDGAFASTLVFTECSLVFTECSLNVH
jgi:hypothetical protein